MKRRILIVDDSATNRIILKGMLSDEYEIIEASNGEEAIGVLIYNQGTISAVLLDIIMPKINGYEVLSQIRANRLLADMPVIMITGSNDEETRVKSLALGANDFVMKPYNTQVIKHCLLNNITLSETSAKISSMSRDKLTGLYSRDTFFEKVGEMVSQHEPGYYIIACFDVEKFKIINDLYGVEKGDQVLKHIAKVFNEGFTANGGICCRISGDVFATLYPTSFKDSKKLAKMRLMASNVDGLIKPIIFCIGRYIIDNITMDPSAMYDRAVMAADSIRGRYDTHIAFFDASMRSHLIEEQEIVTEMEEALENKQFEVWYQPQYNHSTGARIGAEALVRWRHPSKGLISPDVFIPIFEKNGFIYDLDKYVWKTACQYLYIETCSGRNPLPVSVNISRYDLFRPDFLDYLTGLLKNFNIPAAMLRLEVTESAFAESTKEMVAIVKTLIELGFTIEIDDFGSGYSSLNTLKTVPAQILKLDMKFLEEDDSSQRGGNIIQSIVRMSKWLGMSVIAEGVETKAQADFLRSIGCNYIQGYFYARPMPEDEYRILCQNTEKEEKLMTLDLVENLDNNAFWDPASLDSLIFNSYVGGACIFEISNGKLEIVRATEKYARVIGNDKMTVEEVLKLDLNKYLAPDSLEYAKKAIKESRELKTEVSGEYLFIDLPGCPHRTYLHSTLKVIASAGERLLIYCTNDNITPQKESEAKVRTIAEQMQAILSNVDLGIIVALVENGEAHYLFANNRYYEMLGYTEEQFHKEIKSVYNTIAERDRQRIFEETNKINHLGGSTIIIYNAVKKDGSEIVLRSEISIREIFGLNSPVQLSVIRDITSEKKAEKELEAAYDRLRLIMDNLPGGAGIYSYSNGKLEITYLNQSFWQFIGREKALSRKLGPTEVVHPDDVDLIYQEICDAIENGRDMVCDIRMKIKNKGYKPVHLVGRIIGEEENNYTIYLVFTLIKDETIEYQQTIRLLLSAMMESTTDLSFAKDKNLRYISASNAFAKAAGKKNHKDVIGKTDFELFDKKLAEKYYEDDKKLLKSGEPIIDKIEEIPSKDDVSRYSSTSKYLLKDGDGETIGLYGVGRDVTKNMTQGSQLKLINDSVPGGLATYICTLGDYNVDNIKLIYFNEGLCKLFGFNSDEYDEQTKIDPISMVFDKDKKIFEESLKNLIEKDQPLNCVYRIHVKDGSLRWISHQAVVGERRDNTVVVNAIMQNITEQHEAVEKLRITQEESDLAIKLGGNIICRYIIADRIMILSPEAANILSLPEEVLGVPYDQVGSGLVSPETEDAFITFFEEIIHGSEVSTATFQYRYQNGWRWLEAKSSTVFSDDHKPVKAVIAFHDITDKLEKEIIYLRWKQSLKEKTSKSYTLYRCNLHNDSVFTRIDGTLIDFDFDNSGDSFNDRAMKYVDQRVFKDDREAYISFANSYKMLASYYRGKRSNFLEYREIIGENENRWIRLSVDIVERPKATEVEAYLMYEDIDKQKRVQLFERQASETDALTGILNRKVFSDKVDEIISKSKPGTRHALMMLDIDGFKQVNDVFGHITGDQTLIDVAGGLKEIVRHSDLVGRLGGDEFLIFLNDISDDKAVFDKASQICSIVKKSFSMEVYISGSVGIALSPRDGMDFDALYKKADNALYHMKGSGKDGFIIYEANMNDECLLPEQDVINESTARILEKKRRMLIVDDNNLDLTLLQKIFMDDFIIEKAKDGNSALIRLRHYGNAISVVLLDLMMPGMDGFAVLEKMMSSTSLKSIPVIVVSGDESREACLKAIRGGATDFVTKPVDVDVLRIRVNSAISKAENERLQAKNRLLEVQNEERIRYETALDSTGVTFVEYNWLTGRFTYYPSISKYLSGTYDDRKLWHILLSDMVADTQTVQLMQQLIHNLADNRSETSGQLIVKLKTPQKTYHRFRMNVRKQVDEYQLTSKLIIALTDLDIPKQE